MATTYVGNTADAGIVDEGSSIVDQCCPAGAARGLVLPSWLPRRSSARAAARGKL
jgi:hypothetical protein